MVKQKTVAIEYEIEVRYDPESDEFRRALAEYRSLIDETATAKDLVLHVADFVLLNGHDVMMEGVGFVRVGSYVKNESLYCGIEILNPHPVPDIYFKNNFNG